MGLVRKTDPGVTKIGFFFHQHSHKITTLFFLKKYVVQEIMFTSDFESFYKAYLIFSVSFSFENCSITSKN